MSGVYIPGMKMPNRGHTVTLTIMGGGEAVVQYYDCKPQLTVPIVYKAVLIPDHGDLIDRDKLEKDIDNYIGGEESRSRFHHWVQVQRTVIPRERGGGDMSGVYIPGMKMPFDCPACPAAHWNRAGYCTGCEIVPGKRYAMADPDYAFSSELPDWRPLIPVPDHGRLIDADAFATEAINSFMDCADLFDDANSLAKAAEIVDAFVRDINEAPTVIPADKEAET